MNPLFFALEILCPVASESNLNRVFFQCRYLCNKSCQSLILRFLLGSRNLYEWLSNFKMGSKLVACVGVTIRNDSCLVCETRISRLQMD